MRRKKLLAINFGGIGDEILFLPTLATIRRYCPDIDVTLMVEPRSRSVEQVTNLVDNIITFDIKKRPLLMADLVEMLAMIKDGGYDCVVSSGGSPMVSALLFLSGIRERVGYGTSALGSLLLTQPVPLNKNQYAGGMYHDLAVGFLETDFYSNIRSEMLLKERSAAAAIAKATAPLEFSADLMVPVCDLKADSVERMTSLLKSKGLNPSENGKGGKRERIVVLHPGTSRLAVEKNIIKTWPTQSWLELAKMANEASTESDTIRVVLAGGPDDKEAIEEILANKGSLPIISTFGETKSLADLAALIHLSDVIVCVDSAPMHVAVGLQKPVVALFGPTNPNLLIPLTKPFTHIWDERDGKRHFFDGLGVNIEPERVFDKLMATLRGS